MITFTSADSAAVKSAYNRDSNAGAQTEIIRRWPQLTGDEVRVVLERLMASPNPQPPRRGSVCRDITKGRKSHGL